MDITFDPAKDADNLAKHGVSLALAADLEWESALVWPDTRHAYGEPRQSALALLRTRLYFVAFVDRPAGRRVISLRKANPREVKRYVFEN
jgi:uncharacterized DUF497 family protein